MTVDRSPLESYRELFVEANSRWEGALEIHEIVPQRQLNLRIAARDAARWTDQLGVALPSEANTLVHTMHGWIAWLGPDEWLLVSASDQSLTAERLRAAAVPAPASVVDVSAARAIVQIGGGAARQLLAHGCALDLHPEAFPAGRCAQTRIALANAIIAAPVTVQADFDAAPIYQVLVYVSFARYLADWLLDAAIDVETT